MKLSFSHSFKKSYQKLSPLVQKQVDASLRWLMTDIQYPSLQVKKIQGTQNIYELRVSLKYRMSFEIQEDGYFLRKVGEHDALLRNP